MGEIDDIFAGKAAAPAPASAGSASKKSNKAKGKVKQTESAPAAATASALLSEDATSKKKNKKRKSEGDAVAAGEKANGDAEASGSKPEKKKKRKAPPPEEVLDPSRISERAALAAKKLKRNMQAKESHSDSPAAPAAEGTGRNGLRKGRPYVAPTGGAHGDDDDIFTDSRGTGGARKRTEEGYRIFTADELGLDRPGSGETDLCPFDCDCCECTSPVTPAMTSLTLPLLRPGF